MYIGNGNQHMNVVEMTFHKLGRFFYIYSCMFQNIDLHALTGWIPERVSIKLDSPDFNTDSLFDRIFSGLHRGTVQYNASRY